MDAEFNSAQWRKSSRSSGGSNNCVEVAVASENVGVRDTKDRLAGKQQKSPAIRERRGLLLCPREYPVRF
jgi:hypothetical protein